MFNKKILSKKMEIYYAKNGADEGGVGLIEIDESELIGWENQIL